MALCDDVVFLEMLFLLSRGPERLALRATGRVCAEMVRTLLLAFRVLAGSTERRWSSDLLGFLSPWTGYLRIRGPNPSDLVHPCGPRRSKLFQDLREGTPVCDRSDSGDIYLFGASHAHILFQVWVAEEEKFVDELVVWRRLRQ